MSDLWVTLHKNESSCRKIRANQIKEYSYQALNNQHPDGRWMLNISWDRGETKDGDSLFFDKFEQMETWIDKYLDDQI